MSSELLAYCQEAQRLGVSSNAALRLARSLGVKIRRSRWLELWAAAQAAESVFPSRGIARPERAA